MTLRIDLPPDKEAALKAQAEAHGLSAEQWLQQLVDEQLRPAAQDGAPEQPLRTVSEMILRRVRDLPDEAFEGLPKDGASQHDHYIYGTPKRDDL